VPAQVESLGKVLALLVCQALAMLNSLLCLVLHTHRLGQSELFLALCKVVIDLAGLIIHVLMIFAELRESGPLPLQFCLQHVNPVSLRHNSCVKGLKTMPVVLVLFLAHAVTLSVCRAVDDHTHARQTNAL